MSILGTDPRVRAAAVDVVRFWADVGYIILYISSRPDISKNRVQQWLRQHNFPQGLCFFQKGIHHDPYARKVRKKRKYLVAISKFKGEMLKRIKNQNDLDICAAYGSSKDVSIYSSIGIPASKIFSIGRSTRKLSTSCNVS